jgi:hypothetical protein
MLRCQTQLGGFVPIRDNFGFELFAANNDCAEFSLARNISNHCHDVTHPNISVAEAQLVQSMGELKYNRYRLKTAIAWIRHHPRRFFRLTVERLAHFWYPEPDPEGERLPVYSIWMLSTISLAGFLWLAVQRQPIVWFAASVFLFYPAPYYLVQSSARFLYPIFWLNLLCAGYFLHTAFTRFRPPAKQCDNDGAPDLPVIAIGR